MLQERYIAKFVQVRRPAGKNPKSNYRSNFDWNQKIFFASLISAAFVLVVSLFQAAWMPSLEHILFANLLITILAATTGLLWMGIVTFANVRRKSNPGPVKSDLHLEIQELPPTIEPAMWHGPARWPVPEKMEITAHRRQRSAPCRRNRTNNPGRSIAGRRRSNCKTSKSSLIRNWRRP